MSLLNQALFDAIKKRHPEASVTDAGSSGDYQVEENVTEDGKVFKNFVRKSHGDYGERYRINCPFCGDTKKRLYISHLFGRKDSETKFRNLGNLHCFNESCHEDYTNRRYLWDMIELASWTQAANAFEGGDDFEFVEGDIAPRLVVRPGVCLQLSEIPPESEHYRCIEYLRDERHFDIRMLEQFYGVEYILKSHTYSALAGRVWTPFYRDCELAGWTARAIPGLCSEEVRHWHSKGGLGGLLYGLNGAVSSKVLVIVEGPADKWAVGQPAVALLSKSLGGSKLVKLGAALVGSPVELIVVLLDPEQPENEVEKGMEHSIHVAAQRCRGISNIPVLPVFLPLGHDPGGLDGEYLARYLYWSLHKNGYPELGQVLAADVRRSTAARRGLGEFRAG